MEEQRTAKHEQKKDRDCIPRLLVSWLLPRRAKRGQRGFTLLLAALIASIVLALGSSIFSIAQKQVTLSSIGRDSQFAFYAADTAAECALYWDFRYGYFATSTIEGIPEPVSCDGQPMDASGRSDAFPYTMTSQPMDLFTSASPPSDLCAQVTVTKSLDDTTGAIRTVVHANGYSTSCATITTNPRALERSVQLHY
ncbi:MAG: hypothetical protein U1D26_01385 [Patescibacteria group bacterium]|nr:hypothetical protein [Patescibacteria group bacterium]